jgi:hypothetical protein
MSLPTTYRARIPISPQSPQSGAKPIAFLEPAQLTAAVQRPVPRAQLSRRALTALWGLRVLVIIFSAMVIYTFVSQLRL